MTLNLLKIGATAASYIILSNPEFTAGGVTVHRRDDIPRLIKETVNIIIVIQLKIMISTLIEMSWN